MTPGEPTRPPVGGPYPEHEKMVALGDRKQEIQDFLDWLTSEHDNDGPWVIANYAGRHDELYPIRHNKERIMAMYFDIDLDALSREKGWMLDDIRAMNKKTEDARVAAALERVEAKRANYE